MIAPSKLIVLNIGGSLDLGYARITMVQAVHCTGKGLDSSSEEELSPIVAGNGDKTQKTCEHTIKSTTSNFKLRYSGGQAAGWIIQIGGKGIGPIVYHTGDTNVFTDMSIIDQMYKPTHVLMPIDGKCTMGPQEAAFACKNFLSNCHTVIPMRYESPKKKVPGGILSQQQTCVFESSARTKTDPDHDHSEGIFDAPPEAALSHPFEDFRNELAE